MKQSYLKLIAEADGVPMKSYKCDKSPKVMIASAIFFALLNGIEPIDKVLAKEIGESTKSVRDVLENLLGAGYINSNGKICLNIPEMTPENVRKEYQMFTLAGTGVLTKI